MSVLQNLQALGAGVATCDTCGLHEKQQILVSSPMVAGREHRKQAKLIEQKSVASIHCTAFDAE